MRKTVVLMIIFILMNVNISYGHGTHITYYEQKKYEIVATYDDHTPMSDAQVIIYAPNDPKTPYKKGVCNEDGKFIFTPDDSLKGDWTIQVRKSGHGGVIHIDTDKNTSVSNTTAYTMTQKIIMGVCVIWGCIGTALYFRRRT